MTYVARSSDFHGFHAYQATPAPRRRNPLRWLFDAVMNAHQRQTQREIERVVAGRNGVFNDSLEREIAERLQRNDWH